MSRTRQPQKLFPDAAEGLGQRQQAQHAQHAEAAAGQEGAATGGGGEGQPR